MELKYPIFFFIGILLILGFFFLPKKKKAKYHEGIKVANTEFIRKTPYFQKQWKKYQWMVRAMKFLLILSLGSSLFLLSRPLKITEDIQEQKNRDIILCMDVSSSVNELNYEIVDTIKDTVSSLKGERFGIVAFNSSTSTLVPLTDDYEYVLSTLDRLRIALDVTNKKDYQYQDDYGNYYDYNALLMEGTLEGDSSRGSSLIGDGLASCMYHFPDEEENRTKIILFSTDNSLAGTPRLQLKEAASLAKKNKVIVYGIETENISLKDHENFDAAMKITKGKLYSSKEESAKEIVSEIEKTSKSLIKGKPQIIKTDIPFIPFLLLSISLILFIVIRKKVVL